MTTDADTFYRTLSDAVVNMEEELTRDISLKAVRDGVDALLAIENGLVDGMSRAGKLFEEEEYFIPELLLCSDAMYAGLDILQPHIRQEENKQRHKVIIGVVEGDTHDIGKNLVRIMLEASGFDVVDLGRDVAPSRFVGEAISGNAELIALSTLMTTTMDGMAEVIRLLEDAKVRDRIKVIVGGGPVSQSFANRIGADGYAAQAPAAAALVKKLLGVAA